MTDVMPEQPKRVLVVDHDSAMRRLIRLGLEIDGASVLEADSFEQAEIVLADGHAQLDGLVIDLNLPDGDGRDLVGEVRSKYPAARLVALASPEADDVPPPMARVEKGDIPSLVAVLALPHQQRAERRLAAVELLKREQDELVEEWCDLCRWDPMLPPDATPPMAADVVSAVTSAMTRPQPLGWGADPEIERVARDFADAAGSLEAAVGQLVCLREAIRRRITGRVPASEAAETTDRLQMIIDRGIGMTASALGDRLQQQAFVDALTDLLNRRALDRDIRREIGRASRYDRRFAVMVLDLDGLKRINDTQGHNAGDDALRGLAAAMNASLRSGDGAYRIGGDEFVALLQDTTEAAFEELPGRIRAAGAPEFSCGIATYPADGIALEELLDTADQRLFEARRQRGYAQR